MFDSVGWGEVLVLVLASLFILGPDRMPEAAAWLGRAVRTAKSFASGAQARIRDELGPELDEFRGPVSELRQLRSSNPRRRLMEAWLSEADDGKPAGRNGRRTPD